MNCVVNSDSIQLMSSFVSNGGSDGIVDAILTDPPYKVSKRDITKPDGTILTRDFGENSFPLPIRDLVVFFDYILTKDGSILTWCSDSQLSIWIDSLSGCMDKVMSGCWIKTNPAPNIRRRTWTSTIEFWVWAGRGQYTFNWPGHRSGFNSYVGPHLSSRDPEYSGHPNQKPLSILKNHVRVMTNPGDLILDPFAGSGSYIVAAKSSGRNGVGFEIGHRRWKVADERVRNTDCQLELGVNPFALTKKEQGSLFNELLGGRG